MSCACFGGNGGGIVSSSSGLDDHSRGGDGEDVRCTCGWDGDDCCCTRCGDGEDVFCTRAEDGEDLCCTFGWDSDDFSCLRGGDGEDVFCTRCGDGEDVCCASISVEDGEVVGGVDVSFGGRDPFCDTLKLSLYSVKRNDCKKPFIFLYFPFLLDQQYILTKLSIYIYNI